MFEDSVLTEKKNNRPLAFLVSISAELVVVTVLILIPLTYSDHLPGFEWKKIGLGTPVKPIEQKPIPPSASRRTSSVATFHRPFVESSLQRPRAADALQSAAESAEALPIPGNFNPLGSPSGPVIQIPVTLATAPPPPIREQTLPTKTREPIRVGGDVQMAKLVKKVLPSYPALARSIRVSGVVHLIGIIARDGTIRNLQLMSGHPLLARAAIEAVQQWIYQPTLLNGEAVEVIAPIDVNFTLGSQ